MKLTKAALARTARPLLDGTSMCAARERRDEVLLKINLSIW